MKKFLSVVLFVLVAGLAFGAEAQTVPFWYPGEVVRNESGKNVNTAFGMKLDNIKPVLASYSSVSASNTITMPVTYSYVRITDNATDSTNTLSLGTASEGMLMIIHNQDASSTAGIATITSGNMGQVFYASGAWRLLSDE